MFVNNKNFFFNPTFKNKNILTNKTEKENNLNLQNEPKRK
jgi:hypothetical protein